MDGNYLIVAIRNIIKHKDYSIINIAGLAIGLAIFSLTVALSKFQMSFNQFHKDADRIYSIVQVLPSGAAEDRHSARTRAPLRRLLLDEFSEIEDATRWIPTDRLVIRHKKNKFYAEEGTILLVDSNFLTFIRLDKKTQPKRLEQKFPAFIKKYLSESPGLPKELYLLALRDLNLKSYDIRSYWPKEIPQVAYLTFVIGIIMLLAVCFNFMNLAMAGYLMRVKEVGVRKVIGASPRQIMWQFSGESVLLSLIAFPLAIVLKEIMQPLFVFLAAPELSRASPEIWNNLLIMAPLLGVTILVGLIAGNYPSLLLSRQEPVKILRANLPTGKKGVRLRQTLIVLQLIAAIFAVLVTMVSFNQYNYLLKFNVGYERDRVIVVPLGTNHTRSRLRHLKDNLSRHPDIAAVSTAMWIPASWGAERRVVPDDAGHKEVWTMNAYGMDYGFIELLEMEIVLGRSFSRKFADSGSYIINQTAAHMLNWDNPIGKKLTIRDKTGVVIGVVKDFHFKNLIEEIYPTVLFLESNYLNYLYIKLTNAPVSRVLNFVENQWRMFSADMPFEYSMLTDQYGKNLIGIKKWGGMAGLISVFIILFSCLGLFGLASYTTQRRTKEIGIRKAHGATMTSIMRLILTDFLKLIAFAMIITWPLFYFVDRILVPDIFAYSAETGFAFYIYAGALALITGFAAVLYQTIKAGRANPIDALRYE